MVVHVYGMRGVFVWHSDVKILSQKVSQTFVYTVVTFAICSPNKQTEY